MSRNEKKDGLQVKYNLNGQVMVYLKTNFYLYFFEKLIEKTFIINRQLISYLNNLELIQLLI